ncbi:hypothetical protein BRD00_09830 [Halobacteriales archaeon QS_8_69_26]|nr:MAG: hypothetical protein BRD00_09830 [Halobacteriales archaeon QS_8_69_26]
MDEVLALPAVSCSNCGEEVNDGGYIPAAGADGDADPRPDGALCTRCGFSEVGFAGCAPEPGDVEAVDADVLLHVQREEEGYRVLGTKD